ncbi:MAG TPA: sigma-E factor negative regulatory protein [Methylotenera sp.]|jgi:sigma-E factor negative regulatory protein RseA|nr:sigma-E factor negative regulatory protein [Methylotenera sp.]
MKDQLSALIDGELDVASAEHVIKAAKVGGELRSCWAHYHLIGDAIRGDIGHNEAHTSHDFSARVMGALENEPIIFAPNTNINSNLGTNMGAVSKASASNSKLWSIAASVAAVMFVGVMVLQLNQTEELAPMEIAQSVPTEYLQAHQAAAPNGAAFYTQTASLTEPMQ